MNSSTPLKFILTASIALVSSAAFAEDTIVAHPIGLLDKKTYAGNNDQSNFYFTRGPVKKQESSKLLFTAKVKTAKNGDEQYGLFVQNIDKFTDQGYVGFSDINSDAPIKKLATYTFKSGFVGPKFDGFFYADNGLSEGRTRHYPRIYFHIPGKGLYVTEGGGAPKIIRPESAKDIAGTKVIFGAVRLPEYAPDGPDIELQSRIFFAAKDASKGREVFISSGSAATTKILEDIYTAKKVGSEPDQFCTAGPGNESQRVYFSAKNPNDGDSYQLWAIGNPTVVKKKTVYDAIPVTTGASALPGKPENLIGNGFDVFFTCPLSAGGTPVLWHMNADGTGLESYPNALDPQNLTLPTKSPNFSFLTFSAVENGVRYFARWSSGLGSGATVTLLKTVPGDAAVTYNPQKITNAGNNYNYFAGTYAGDNAVYLIKHGTAGANDLQTVIVGGVYPKNIGEICSVIRYDQFGEPIGSGGVVYFTGDLAGVGNDILMKIDADGTTAAASVVTNTNGLPIVHARNLHAVASQDGPGFDRLYFTAPINSDVNGSYIPQGSTITDFGTKPWVVGE